MSALFCFGLGYSAGVLARRLAAQGWHISGTSTTAAGASGLAAQGYAGYVFDGKAHSADVHAALQTATHLVLSIPPGADGDPALRVYGQAIAASPSLTWIGYLSTVGVYGDAAGGWVDEDTPAQPTSERGKRRLDAELAWRALARRSGKTAMVFRLPGIYGPGRSTIEDLRDGTARRLIKAGQVFNRIHVEDIASCLEAAIRTPHADRVYNLTDDEPGPPQDVVAYGADLLGLPVPPDMPFETADLSAMARSFYSESKRVSNARMKRELGARLAYPTYREGLASLVRR